MNRKLIIALSTSAALAAPLAAQAQDSATVHLTANVAEACVVGEPDTTTLNLGDLTGSNGLITSDLASVTTFSTAIETAWCNTPSKMTLSGDPMALTTTPGYSTPAGFARLVTYDATLEGWPAPILIRPLVLDTSNDASANTAHASQLDLVISKLAAVDGTGAESTTAVLEAGGYAGAITISVAAE